MTRLYADDNVTIHWGDARTLPLPDDSVDAQTWTIPSGNAQQFDHPCVFPIERPRRLITLYSYVGDTVLDPFMGSGTTLQAARLLRRHAVGMKQSAKYCSSNRRRR